MMKASNQTTQAHRQSANWRLLGLTGLGFLLRVFHLGYHELRGDEAFGLLFSSQSVGAMLQQTLAYLEPHPPLDYVLLHFWTQIAGDSEWAIRFTSLAFSVAAIPLIYQLSRLLLDERVALWAALFVAVNPFQVWHAQEARMYAISTTLGLAASLALLRAERSGGTWPWVVFVLLSTANAYTHYYALFIIAALGLYWLSLWRRHRRQWAAWLASQGAIVLLYLPWLVVGWRVMTAYHGNGDSPAFVEMLGRILTAFSVGQTMAPAIAAYILPVIVAVFALGWVVLARDRWPAAVFLALYLAVPVLSVYASSLSRPVFNERYLIAATPPFIVVMAAGVAGLSRLLGKRDRWTPYVLGALIVASSFYSLAGYFFNPEFTRNRGWRELAARLEQAAAPDDLIVENYPDPTLWYYYKGAAPHIVAPAERPLDMDKTIAALQAAGETYERVWFVPYKSTDWDAEGAVGTWLDRHWERLSEEGVGDFALRLYRPARVALAESVPTEARWADQIGLRAYRLEPSKGQTRFAPGDAVTLTLFWEAFRQPTGDFTVFAHLTAPDGRIVAQRDSQPLRGGFPTSAWQPGELILDRYVIIIPADAGPGHYTLSVGWYDADTGDRLAVQSDPAEGQDVHSAEARRAGDRYELTSKLTVGSRR